MARHRNSESPNTWLSPIIPTPMPAELDAAALGRELEGAIDGEVRFDAVSRALYSTDASVYQIQPAGVVIPKSRADLVRVVEACRRHGCSITMRGGGTSQAGQAIGAGLVVDTSKYLNRLLEVNAAERWARVEPGIVLDELNAALAPHRLRFAPDISTREPGHDRRHDRQQLRRRAVGDLRQDHRSRAGAARCSSRTGRSRASGRRRVPSSTSSAVGRHLKRPAIGKSDGLPHECAGEIERRYPKVLRRVGGYNLDEFVSTTGPRRRSGSGPSISRSSSSVRRERSASSSRPESTSSRCRRPRPSS